MTTALAERHSTAIAPAHPTRGGRIRAWGTQALRDLGYLGAVFAWSLVGCTIWVTGASLTASMLVLIVGVFIWIGFAYLMRATTLVDRGLAGWLRGEPVAAVYRRPSEGGFMPFLKTITTDPQTWRDFGWLAPGSVVGFALGLAALTAAGLTLAYITLPIWYWAIQDPQAQYAVTNLGLFTVDTLGEAFAATAIGLAVIPLVMLLARGAAAGHAALAARLLGARRS